MVLSDRLTLGEKSTPGMGEGDPHLHPRSDRVTGVTYVVGSLPKRWYDGGNLRHIWLSEKGNA